MAQATSARRRCTLKGGETRSFDSGRMQLIQSLDKSMAAPAASPVNDPLRDLAAKIYIELICRNVVVTDNAAQIKSNPESLAKISFKLAEVFQRVGVEVKAPSLPKNQEFDMRSTDISNWNASKP